MPLLVGLRLPAHDTKGGGSDEGPPPRGRQLKRRSDRLTPMISAVHLPSDHSCSCQICSEHADVFGNITPPTNAATVRPWPRKPTNSSRRTHVSLPGILASPHMMRRLSPSRSRWQVDMATCALWPPGHHGRSASGTLRPSQNGSISVAGGS